MRKKIFLVLILIATSAYQAKSQSVEPTDTDLKASFNQNRSCFEKMAKMLLAEKCVDLVASDRINNYLFDGRHWSINGNIISFDEITRETDITHSNWNTYRKLLKLTGSTKASFCDGKTFLKFEKWRSFLEPKPALEDKCIIYCSGAKPPGSVEKDTYSGRPKLAVNAINSPRKKLIILSPISKDWYIMFTRYGNTPPTPPWLLKKKNKG